MDNLITLNGIQYQIIKRDKESKKAILKQVSHLTKCLMYGGQYTFVLGRNVKNYCTLDCANKLYQKN